LLGQSLARWRHRKDQSELNSQLWVSVLEHDMLVQQAKSVNDSDGPPAQALRVRTDADGKVGHDMADLRRRAEVAYTWKRLFTLLMAVSALERYVLAAATAAVESDPLLIPGFPKLADGLLLKKRGRRVHRPDLTSTVKGPWGSRIAILERLFGSVPSELKDAQSELEKIRKMRNAVAHNYGIDDTVNVLPPSVSLITSARSDRLARPRSGLSRDRLIRWLGLLNEISVALDKQLTNEYIGDYEIAAIYLDWKERPESYEKALGITLKGTKRSHDQRFVNFISAAIDLLVGSDYGLSLQTFLLKL
jgi:hypothetical protein